MAAYSNKVSGTGGRGDVSSGASRPEDRGAADEGASDSVFDTVPDTTPARSTDNIEEFARICLQHSHYRAIRRIRCSFSKGVLTLHGNVPTYHYKQLAQTAICDIPGVDRIINAIDVG